MTQIVEKHDLVPLATQDDDFPRGRFARPGLRQGKKLAPGIEGEGHHAENRTLRTGVIANLGCKAQMDPAVTGDRAQIG